ncbi:Restnol dehydrogenase [Entamoeba marina]
MDSIYWIMIAVVVAVFIVASIAVLLFIARRHSAGAVNKSHRNLVNKVIVVTGGTNGIGKLVIKKLAKSGAVIVSCSRNDKLANKVVNEIKEICPSVRLTHVHLDLNDLESVAECAKQINEQHDRIDILINNAGVMNVPYSFTKQGFEKQMGVNYIGHFLFTQLLLPSIRATNGRVINASSSGSFLHTKPEFPFNVPKEGFNSMRTYGESKLAMDVLANELSKRESTITAGSFHPGAVRTDLWKHFSLFARIIMSPITYIFFKSPEEGIQTTMHLIMEENIVNGAYYDNCKPAPRNPLVENEELCNQLWNDSMEAVRDYLN